MDHTAPEEKLCLLLVVEQAERTINNPAPISGRLQLNFATDDEPVGLVADRVSLPSEHVLGQRRELPLSDIIVSRPTDRLTIQTNAEHFDAAYYYSIESRGAVLRIEFTFGSIVPIRLEHGEAIKLLVDIRRHSTRR